MCKYIIFIILIQEGAVQIRKYIISGEHLYVCHMCAWILIQEGARLCEKKRIYIYIRTLCVSTYIYIYMYICIYIWCNIANS